MVRLKRMQDKVEYLLKTYPVTRDDDRKLIGAVYTVFYGVDVNAPFKEILLNEKSQSPKVPYCTIAYMTVLK